MSNPEQDLREEVEARDRAISVFLNLGEKLRSIYQGDRRGWDQESRLDGEDADALMGAIEGEIIPRLMLAHRSQEVSAYELPSPDARIHPEDRERFLEIVMTESAAAARGFVEGLLVRGVALPAVFLDLLANAARRLGEMWETDECDFTDVTIGLCRLHQVLREQSVLHDAPGTAPDAEAPRVLLATACGDQHVFGVVMVAEFFRRSGWRVWSEPGAVRSQVAGLLARESFDVLGLSAACSQLLEELAEEIRMLRRASRNAGMKVLVGGRLFSEEPELFRRAGADGTAVDARSAPGVADGLLERAGIRY